MTPEEQLHAFIRRDKDAVDAFNDRGGGIENRIAFISGRLEDVTRLVVHMLRREIEREKGTP